MLEGLAEWQSRPLDAVYAVLFIDVINVKIRVLSLILWAWRLGLGGRRYVIMLRVPCY